MIKPALSGLFLSIFPHDPFAMQSFFDIPCPVPNLFPEDRGCYTKYCCCESEEVNCDKSQIFHLSFS